MFITHGPVQNNVARVLMVICKEIELSEEAKASGLYIDSIPEAAVNQGFPILYVNVETKELWYEYEPIPALPLYPNTEVGQMQKEIDDLKLIIAELVTGGAV